MRKGAIALGILGALLGLAGCNQAPKKEQPKENPAPKPPHCPDLPELKNITLTDGSIADVRIIRIDETNLYFPAEWLKTAFLDIPSSYPWEQREGKRSIGMTIPDLYQNECPGVVHTINLDREVPEIGIPIGKQISSWKFVNGRGVVSNEIRSLGLSTSHIPSGSHRWLLHTGNGLWVWLVPIKGVMMYAGVSREYPNRQVESQSLTELAQWLATPPNRRDNDRTFTVQIDEVTE